MICKAIEIVNNLHVYFFLGAHVHTFTNNECFLHLSRKNNINYSFYYLLISISNCQ